MELRKRYWDWEWFSNDLPFSTVGLRDLFGAFVDIFLVLVKKSFQDFGELGYKNRSDVTKEVCRLLQPPYAFEKNCCSRRTFVDFFKNMPTVFCSFVSYLLFFSRSFGLLHTFRLTVFVTSVIGWDFGKRY